MPLYPIKMNKIIQYRFEQGYIKLNSLSDKMKKEINDIPEC